MKKRIAIILTLMLIAVCAIPVLAQGGTDIEVPPMVGYQGYLTDSGGTPVDGTVSITFSLYDAESGGSPLWTETQSVTVNDGLFNVLLGSVVPLSPDVFDGPCYLGITVSGDSEMTPRQQIVSVAYALAADQANSAATLNRGVLRDPGLAYGANTDTHVNLGVDSVTGSLSADAQYATVGGGGPSDPGNPTTSNNRVYDDYGTIGGGGGNSVGSDDADSTNAAFATISGGGDNSAANSYSTVGGGTSNAASGYAAVVGGGSTNTASNNYATVSGGTGNTAGSAYATVGGGNANSASGTRSTVTGGQGNTASGPYSVVDGGSGNTAAGNFSWAGGRNMQLTGDADHTFVWGYADSAQSIATPDAFLIFPAGTSGNVGIGTSTPSAKLDVQGDVNVNGTANVTGFQMATGAADGYVLKSDPAGVGTWQPAPETGIDGSGTADYLAKFIDATTIGDSVIYETSGGRIGIGTTSPSFALDVNGTIGSLGASSVSVVGESSNGRQGVLGSFLYGVYGETGPSVGGTAVKGLNSHTGNYGELGTSAYGVYGETGLSASDVAVYGLNSLSGNFGSLGGDNEGVWGEDSEGNYGTLGNPYTDTGVYGWGSAFGVEGNSLNGTGIFGYTANGTGVSGHTSGESYTSYGVYGENEFGNNWGYLGSIDGGVYGYSSDKDGVHGQSDSGWGVVGTSDSGTGVYGYSSDNHGVHGVSDSGWGVAGTSDSGTGVYGSSISGAAGYFEGDLHASGKVDAHGFQMTTGASNGYVLTSNISGIGTWQPVPEGIDGSGTTGYVPKFTASATLGNSAIYENSGDVGVGTTSPGTKLDVTGTVRGTGSGGDYGELGLEGVGVWGEHDATGNHGSLGSNYEGVLGKYGSTGPFGRLGAADYGAYGMYPSTGNYGELGTSSAGVYGNSSSGTGLYGISTSGTGIEGRTSSGSSPGVYGFGPEVGVWGECTNASGDAGYFLGNLTVQNGDINIINGDKHFVMPDPSDPTKDIYYSTLEGPEAGTYIRGSAELVDGEAIIELPQHFADVTADEGLTVQLTPVGKWLQLYVVEKSTTRLIVREATGQSGTFDYVINGVRKGYEDYQVIRDAKALPDKDDGVVSSVTQTGVDSDTP